MSEIVTRIPYDACPLCCESSVGSTLSADCSQHPLYDPRLSPTITWHQCAACDHIYTDGYFTPEAAAIVYARSNDAQCVGFDLENQRQVSARIVDRLLPFADAGDWLDVGFGNGALLFTAEEYGFVPVGIELRGQNVDAMRGAGFEAYCSDIAGLDAPGRFAVISMCDVLEHMPFPGAALQAAHALLRADGLLFLSMPNSDSVLWQVLHGQDLNPYWGELEHYHNFGRRRLYTLLRSQGFVPLRYGVSERYRIGMEVICRKLS